MHQSNFSDALLWTFIKHSVGTLKNKIEISCLKYIKTTYFHYWTAVKQYKPVSLLSNIFPWKSPCKGQMAVLGRDTTEYSESVVINQYSLS